MAGGNVLVLIAQAARHFGVPVALAYGVAQQESNFRQSARGGVGEIGIFQITPRWWDRWARSQGWDIRTTEGNVMAGVAILAGAIRAEGSFYGALRRYNGGPAYNRPGVAEKTDRYARSVLARAKRFASQGIGAAGDIPAAVPAEAGAGAQAPPAVGPVPPEEDEEDELGPVSVAGELSEIQRNATERLSQALAQRAEVPVEEVRPVIQTLADVMTRKITASADVAVAREEDEERRRAIQRLRDDRLSEMLGTTTGILGDLGGIG